MGEPTESVIVSSPAAVCRICATAIRLDVTSADSLSAHVRRFMDAHHHDGGSDIVIDITDVSDARQAC